MVTTIHIEGIDRTGKDTIAALLSTKSNLKFYITARSPISTFAYGRIYNRETMSLKELRTYFSNPEILLVYLVPDRDIINQRCKDTNHEHVNDKDFTVFHNVVNNLKEVTKVLELDISQTPEQMVDKIMSEVKEK